MSPTAMNMILAVKVALNPNTTNQPIHLKQQTDQPTVHESQPRSEKSILDSTESNMDYHISYVIVFTGFNWMLYDGCEMIVFID